MNVLDRQIDGTRGLKVVLFRYPFTDHTNKLRMPDKLKNCDTYDTEMQPSKSNDQVEVLQRYGDHKQSGRNFRRCRKLLKNESTETVPVVKSCKILLESTNLAQKLQSKGPNDLKIKSPRLTVHLSPVKVSTPLVKRLRKCEERNYFESSLECSTPKIEIPKPCASNRKIPIYKQNIIEESNNKNGDPYALDIPDSNDKKTKKPSNFNSSRKFNKTMYDLLEKLQKKEKKGKKKPLKYNDKVDGVLKKVMNKINDKKKIVAKSEKIYVTKNTAKLQSMKKYESVIKDGFLGFRNSDIKNAPVPDDSSRKNDISRKADFIGFANSNNVSKQNNNINISVITNNEKEPDRQPIFIKSINGYENESGFLGFVSNNYQFSKPQVGQADGNINIITNICLRSVSSSLTNIDDSYCRSDTDSENQYFGFDEDNNDDVDFRSCSTIGSPVFFNRRPNANSTMIGEPPKSPWRLTLPYRRNNHFLTIKPNSLPSLNQDMVLDHTITEEIEQKSKAGCEEVPLRPKTPAQTSILDFVQDSTDHCLKPRSDIKRSSLFDYDEFIVSKPKRKILGLLQENTISREQVESTPRKYLQNQTGSQNDSEASDFFQDYQEDQENRKSNKRKPFRVDLQEIIQYKKNAQIENVPDLPITEENVLEPSELSNESIMENKVETVAEDVHLFEDIDSKQDVELSIKLPNITYKRKRRRKRLMSETCEEAEEEKPKKKKKDVMTKAELNAFEKWAQEFNSMCKEIDEHDLEIE